MIATFGSTWNTTMKGVYARESTGNSPRIAPIDRPKPVASRNPQRISFSVTHACSHVADCVDELDGRGSDRLGRRQQELRHVGPGDVHLPRGDHDDEGRDADDHRRGRATACQAASSSSLRMCRTIPWNSAVCCTSSGRGRQNGTSVVPATRDRAAPSGTRRGRRGTRPR